MKQLIVILTAILLTGCATWSHPSKGEAGFEADLYECQRDGAAVQDNLRRLFMEERCLKIKGWKLG